MFGKKFFSTMLLTISAFTTVHAQDVIVTGMGIDRESAVRDASRRAVEQVVGTFIDSRTLMENFVIQFDEVYKKSQGFIKNIQILEERKIDKSICQVKAKIDVDTDPDGKLINELTMIMQLNDPRIAVIILENNKNQVKHIEEAESAFNSKLLKMGFNHVIDAAHVMKISDVQLLSNIYSGKIGSFKGKVDHAADYLILGKCNRNQMNISIPNYGESGMKKTDLINSQVNLKVDVIKYDTGEIIGSFTTDAIGIGNEKNRSGNQAVINASDKAAEKVAEIFKKFSANTTQGLTFTITASNESKLLQAINDLRLIGAVENIHIREQNKNTAILSVDSPQNPSTLMTMLKNNTKLKITVENISNSSCKFKVG